MMSGTTLLTTFGHSCILNIVDENEKREAERQMIHSELRNLAMGALQPWLVHQELAEFCNLDNLIIPRSDTRSIFAHILHYEWERKRAGKERRLFKKTHHLKYSIALNREADEWKRKVKENPELLNRWPTNTRILSWCKDQRVSSVGLETWFEYEDNSGPGRGIGNMVKDGRLSRMLNDCNALKLRP